MLKLKSRIVRSGLVFATSALIAILPLGTAYAATLASTGQPNVECEDAGAVPGHTAMSPGSAFSDFGKSGTVYAGEQAVNSKNPNSVSQYDIACFKIP
jgi:hypothetical protein